MPKIKNRTRKVVCLHTRPKALYLTPGMEREVKESDVNSLRIKKLESLGLIEIIPDTRIEKPKIVPPRKTREITTVKSEIKEVPSAQKTLKKAPVKKSYKSSTKKTMSKKTEKKKSDKSSFSNL